MVKLRLKRFGRRNRPYYRIDAIDSQRAPKGLAIEELGQYDPLEKDAAKAVKIKQERVEYWLKVGAQPSDTVRALLRKAGVAVKDGPMQVRAARKAARAPKA